MMTTEEFIAAFDLPKEGFGDAIQLNDTEFGFSLYKTRKEEGFKSLIRVFVDDRDQKTDSSLKNLTVTASYGKETEHGITISSTSFKRGTNWPLELTSKDDFFVDLDSGNFYFQKQQIAPFEILKKIDTAHTLPQRRFNYGSIRIKTLLFFQRVVAKFIELTFELVATTNFILTDHKVKIYYDIGTSRDSRMVKPHYDDEQKDAEDMDLLGIKIPQSLALTYAIFHLAVFCGFYYFGQITDFVEKVFSNNFLTLMYVVLSIGIWKRIFPMEFGKDKSNVLVLVLKLLQSARFSTLTRSIKVPIK